MERPNYTANIVIWNLRAEYLRKYGDNVFIAFSLQDLIIIYCPLPSLNVIFYKNISCAMSFEIVKDPTTTQP